MKTLFIILSGLVFSFSALAKAPNVVLILADDLGFSDTSPYGGEIHTPSIQQLANEGVSFTNYHTAASCAPTRGMLLTGVDSHKNGVPNIPEAIPPQQKHNPNYKGTLNHNVVTVATLLQDAGYHTYMAGKWHLGKEPDLLPFNRGFERTLSMADTGADNWEQKPYLIIYEKANWFADGEPVIMPEDFYSSDLLVDKTIEFIDSNKDDDQPFFAYLPFQAVHMPVQAPQVYTDKYMDTYQDGWSALRKQRQLNAKALGVVPQDSDMVDMHTTADWESESEEEKHYHKKRMAVYAGMVESMDDNIGRLMNHLKAIGEYDNTIFIFTSDNGSESTGSDQPLALGSRLLVASQGYENGYENLGLKGSFVNIGPSFASASASPLAYYKFQSGEGGMRVPLVIAGTPIKNVQQGYQHAFTYVTDITPTILELTKTKAAGKYYGGRLVEPMVGKSLVPLLNGKQSQVYEADEAIGYELAGNAALFMGDYKIVYNRGPIGDDQWHLYNIAKDPGETMDLSESMPQRFENMLAAYDEYVKVNKVEPVPAGYQQRRQVALNGLKKRFGADILLWFLTALVLAGFYLAHKRSART